MTELFDFMGNKVRVVVMPNETTGAKEPWFVTPDIRSILGLTNATAFVSNLSKTEVRYARMGSARYGRPSALVSESGLYKLVMRSNKPQAKAFQDWIARDVLPAVRKDGLYVRGEEKVLTGEMSLEEMTLKVITGMQDKGVVCNPPSILWFTDIERRKLQDQKVHVTTMMTGRASHSIISRSRQHMGKWFGMSAPCAIWNTRTHDSSRSTSGDKFQYDSPRAGGGYEITGTAKQQLGSLNDAQKARLTSWLVEQHDAGNECPLLTSAEVDRVKGSSPLDLGERRDRLLKIVAAHTPMLGETMEYREYILAWSPNDPPRENPHWAEYDALRAATESVKFDEVEALIEFAKLQGLLKSDSRGLSLTFEGHTHLEKMRATPQTSSQAFIAMWFANEVTDAYEHGIAPAVTAAGYRPMRIDRKEHNNKIDDEIIAEIRRSRFVVADFTCGLVGEGKDRTAIPRGGVYYEAGFAQGLGIPVIWTCREDHIGHVHFDTRQFNHITWTGPDDLREKLRNRIGAVLGDGPLYLA